MEWTNRELPHGEYPDQYWQYREPEESGLYWVTDGVNIHLAHFDKQSPIFFQWRVYKRSHNGFVGDCTVKISDPHDMRISPEIRAYYPVMPPPLPELDPLDKK